MWAHCARCRSLPVRSVAVTEVATCMGAAIVRLLVARSAFCCRGGRNVYTSLIKSSGTVSTSKTGTNTLSLTASTSKTGTKTLSLTASTSKTGTNTPSLTASTSKTGTNTPSLTASTSKTGTATRSVTDTVSTVNCDEKFCVCVGVHSGKLTAVQCAHRQGDCTNTRHCTKRYEACVIDALAPLC
jgi:hypothetical protein